MQGAKDIVFAMLNAKGADLQSRSAVDQVVYRTVAEELLKHSDSDTWPNAHPPKQSKMPGSPSMG